MTCSFLRLSVEPWHKRKPRWKNIGCSSCQRPRTCRLGILIRELKSYWGVYLDRDISSAVMLLFSKPAHKSWQSSVEKCTFYILSLSCHLSVEHWAQHRHGSMVQRHQVSNSFLWDSHIESCSYSKLDCCTRRNVDELEAVSEKWDIVLRVCNWVQRSRACPGSSLRGGAGLLGHTVGQASLCLILFLSVSSWFVKHTDKCRASSVSNSPVLRWFKLERK